MNEVTYHTATITDVDLVVDMRLRFSDELVGRQSKEKEDELRQSLIGYFSRELGNTYLCCFASVEGMPVSIAGLGIRVQPGNVKNPSGIWGYIMSVYTVPAFRKRGLSSKVIRSLIELARQHGVQAFELHATKDGEQVYRNLGFDLHPEPTYRKY